MYRENNIPKIKLSYVIYIFLFVFAPPIVPKVNFILILFAYSLIQLLTKYKRRVMYAFKQSGALFYTKLMLVSMIYLTVIMFFGFLLDPVNLTNYINTWYRFFMIFPVVITCIIFIILRSEELGYGFKELLKGLIYAGLIQATTTMLMLLFPEFRNFLLKVLYFNTGNELSQNLWHIQRRFYAFSHNVFDTFGYGAGILAALPLFYGILTNKYKYFTFALFLLLVPLFNSRTGLIIFFIGVSCVFPFVVFQTNFKRLFKAIFVFLIMYIVILISFSFLVESFPNTFGWVESGINDVLGFLKGEMGDDSLSVITSSEKWHMPESIWILTGTGHNVYGARGYYHSDVGYVNDIWLVGILGLTLLYLPIITLFIKALKEIKILKARALIVFLMASFFVTNIKTIVLNYNVGTSIVFLITLFMIFNRNSINRIKKIM